MWYRCEKQRLEMSKLKHGQALNGQRSLNRWLKGKHAQLMSMSNYSPVHQPHLSPDSLSSPNDPVHRQLLLQASLEP